MTFGKKLKRLRAKGRTFADKFTFTRNDIMGIPATKKIMNRW